MAKKRGLSPLMIILPVVCLGLAVAAVYLTMRRTDTEPAPVPQVTPIAQLQGTAPIVSPPVVLPQAPPKEPVRSNDPYAGLSGLVVEGSGKPVKGIGLTISGPTGVADGNAVSSATGFYRFTRLLPGPCSLLAEATGYARTGLAGLNLIAGVTLPDATVLLLPEAPIHGQVRANLTSDRLAGARVTATLYSIDQKLIPLVAEFHQSITAIADASGNYTLRGLWSHVHYDLVAEASGFVRGQKTQVESGQAGVDFVLSKGGAISGVAVQAGSGEPAAGAMVTGRRLDLSAYTVNTDGQGRFFLSGLPRGEYDLDAVWNNCFAAPDAALQRISVEVGREVMGVTVELTRGGSVAGRVVDKRDQQPIAGAALELSSAWGKAAVESDARGGFQFGPLRNGDYQLSVAARAYSATTVFVQIAGGTDTEREIGLSGGDVIAGYVRDKSGHAVEGAVVRYARQRPNDMRYLGGAERYQGEAITSATGYFRYQPLENGVYDLAATATDFAPGRLAGVETGLQEVEVLLAEGGGVTGSVTSSTGEVLPGVRVSVSGIGLLNNNRDLSGAETRTDERGEYRVMHLEPGNYIVSVELPRRRLTDQQIEQFRRGRGGQGGPQRGGGGRGPRGNRGQGQQQGSLAPLSPAASVQVAQAAPLMMQVDGGALRAVPVVQAQVQVAQVVPPAQRGRGQGGRRGGQRGGDFAGGFGGPPGSAEMRTRQVVNVKEGEVAIAHFGARDCVTLNGVVMKQNKPVEGIWVGLSEGETEDIGDVRRFGVANTRTDQDGKFQLTGLLPEGLYFAHVARGMENLPVSQKVRMPQSGEKSVTITLPEGGVRGVVVDANGQAVRGANVSLESAAEEGGSGQPVRVNMSGMRRGGRGGATTDRAGAFQIGEVAEGRYYARAVLERKSALAPVEVKGDGMAEVRITLGATGSMEGKISGMGIDGQSRVNAMFLLRDPGSGAVTPVFAFRGFAGGEYKLDDLAPGRYDVSCLVYMPDAVLAPEEETGVTIRAGEATRCNFAMDPGVMVRLDIVDETGLPLRDAQVQVRDGYGNPLAQGVAVMDNAYNTWTASFQRRNYTLWVGKPGYREARLALDLAESDASVRRRVVLVNEKIDLGAGGS